MILKYKIVDFSYHNQYLVLTKNKNQIVVYDMKISSQIKVLEKHKEKIDCLKFIQDHDIVVSFSEDEKLILFWSLKTEGFMKQLFLSNNPVI